MVHFFSRIQDFFDKATETFQQKRGVFIGALIALCSAFFLLSYTSVWDESVTIDEVAHIVSGYTTLKTSAITMNIEHPPLVKEVAALPLLFLPLHYYAPESATPNQWEEGSHFLFSYGNDTDSILRWARGAVLLFNTLLLFIIGFLLTRFFSRWWTLIAVIVLAFEPIVLAHAHYVTTDIPVAFIMVIVLLLLGSYLKSPSYKAALSLGLALALSLVVKFSAVALLVYVLFILVLGAVYHFWKKQNSVVTLLVHVTSMCAIMILSVWIFYTCASFATPTKTLDKMIESSMLPKNIKEMQYPLASFWFTKAIPAYSIGFDYAQNRTEQKGEVTGLQFLDGEYHMNGQGWREYFLKALWYKWSPVSLLLIFIALGGLCVALLKRKSMDLMAALFALFALGYLMIAMRSSLNIGVRHVAPLVVLLPLVALFVLKSWRQGMLILAVLLLLLAHMFVALFAFPYYLSYFNVFAGGSQHGYEHLSDSNVDWGQNMKRISQWAEDHHVEKLYVDYWGKTPTHYYDKKNILESWHVEGGKPDGYFAILSSWISQSMWLHTKGLSEYDYGFLKDIKPVDQVGPSIFIYDLRKK